MSQSFSSSHSTLMTGNSSNNNNNNNNNIPTLYLSSQPHLDIYSNIVYTYLIFTGIKFNKKTIPTHQVLSSIYSNHVNNNEIHFPILKHENVTIYGMKEILNYLKNKNENIDITITLNDEYSTSNLQQIKSEMEVYINIVKEKCLPIYLFYFWKENFNNITKNIYFKNYNLFLQWFFIYVEKSKHLQLLKNLNNSFLNNINNYKNLNTEELVNKLFLECLDSLSVLLGNNLYFYGNKPSTLDCIVYGYLSILNNLENIKTYLNQHLNLKHWLENMNQHVALADKYFEQLEVTNLSSEQITNQSNSFNTNIGMNNNGSVGLLPKMYGKSTWYIIISCASIVLYFLMIFRKIKVKKHLPVAKAKTPIYYYDSQLQ
ncbi:hypothetical protein ABK040_011972 [Willaertia magna]